MPASVEDKNRNWAWWILAVLVVPQFYFAKELLSAFALFTLAFAAIVLVIVAFIALQHVSERIFAYLATASRSAMNLAPHGKGNQPI
jgi:hypothetical protein